MPGVALDSAVPWFDAALLETRRPSGFAAVGVLAGGRVAALLPADPRMLARSSATSPGELS